MKKIKVNIKASLDLNFEDEVFQHLQKEKLLNPVVFTTINTGLNNTVDPKMGDFWRVDDWSWEVVQQG